MGSPRIVAFAFGAFWAVLFFGLIDLAIGVEPGGAFYLSHLLETGWGLTFTFLVAAPFFALAVGPRRWAKGALQQIALTGAGIGVGALLSTSPPHLLVTLAMGGCVGVVAFLGEIRTLHRRPGRWSWLPGCLVAIAAGPWVWYALDAAAAAREGRLPIDDTWGLDHWPIQAAFALAVVLVATLASDYPLGWRVPTWCVGVVAVWIGLDSFAYPDLGGSFGRTWGIIAAFWGGAFVVAMHIGDRVTRNPPRRTTT